ncbi:unnamed protein product [Clonostachys rosea]|uniref:Uncharacterized protein n=1 Tax=Bionectria ochroleuca TaxID=29856 RepID=A0ABY6URJ4_BIOOC|nr:unnamed protein product [Clonostachys rosea]
MTLAFSRLRNSENDVKFLAIHGKVVIIRQQLPGQSHNTPLLFFDLVFSPATNLDRLPASITKGLGDLLLRQILEAKLNFMAIESGRLEKSLSRKLADVGSIQVCHPTCWVIGVRHNPVDGQLREVVLGVGHQVVVHQQSRAQDSVGGQLRFTHGILDANFAGVVLLQPSHIAPKI